MTETKKKIIWTLLAISISGLTAYSVFIHDPDHDKFGCPLCSIRNVSGIVGFVAGICVFNAINVWQKS